MKKLTYDQIITKEKEYSKKGLPAEALIRAIVDSINENIDDDEPSEYAKLMKP